MNYEANTRQLLDNAQKSFGGIHGAGAGLSAVFAHNRGMPKTNIAIFQQNLIIVSEGMGNPAASGFKVDGEAGAQTVKMLQRVCKAKGITRIAYSDKGREMSLDVASLDPNSPGSEETMGKAFSNYKNMARFFNENFAGQAISLLDTEYLGKHKANLPAYLKNYFVFFSPGASETYSSKTLPQKFQLGIKVFNGPSGDTIAAYTTPKEAKVILKVYGMDGKQVAMPVNSSQEPGEHRIALDMKGLKPGVYVCRISCGQEEKAAKVIVGI